MKSNHKVLTARNNNSCFSFKKRIKIAPPNGKTTQSRFKDYLMANLKLVSLISASESISIKTNSFIFTAHQVADGITVRASEVSIASAKPKMKTLVKSNKTVDGEVQITSDTRVRRLIPYMSFYHPGHEYSYNPLEFLPVVNKETLGWQLI